jgi:hypothetical protein
MERNNTCADVDDEHKIGEIDGVYLIVDNREWGTAA